MSDDDGGRVVLVTGGSRGIGAATCRAAAAAGWSVCLTYARDADAAAGVVADVETHGVRAAAVRCEVTEESDVAAAFDAAATLARRTGGCVAGLVTSAGIVAEQARVDELSAERVQRMLAVNVLGTILPARDAVRRMSARHGGAGGSIVLVSSAASRLGSAGEYVDYAASKAAVDTLGLGLSKEVADEGVRVNVVRPGIVETDIHASGGRPDRAAQLGPSVPLGRAGTADEVAAAIVWLLGPEATYCTGTVLDVAGGR